MRADGDEASLSFKAPAYSADAFFARVSGEYEVTITSDGFLVAMNELHKGRDAGGVWSFWIDLSGIFLTVVSFTGFGILLYLKKMRAAALITASVGVVVMVVLMWLAW